MQCLSKLAKKDIQLRINSGTIPDVEALLIYVKSQGWCVTRHGENYMGILHSDGKRFRVRFEFGVKNVVSLGGNSLDKEYYFYALFGICEFERITAVYVGQTINFSRRMKEHRKGHRIGKSSYDLFDWVEKKNSAIQLALLAKVKTDASTAYLIEKHFTQLAIAAGCLTPGIRISSQKTDAPNLMNLPTNWPETAQIRAQSHPFLRLIFHENGVAKNGNRTLKPMFNLNV
jgi:predicted GIY-YIG superfamily endonuclease